MSHTLATHPTCKPCLHCVVPGAPGGGLGPHPCPAAWGGDTPSRCLEDHFRGGGGGDRALQSDPPASPKKGSIDGPPKILPRLTD